MKKKKQWLTFLLIFAIGEIGILFGLLAMVPQNPTGGFAVGWIIAFAALTVLIGVCAYCRAFKGKSLAELHSDGKDSSFLKSGSFFYSCKLKLVGGLPFPEGTTCKMKYGKEKMLFLSNGQEVSLDASKLVDISVMTNTEIQKQYVSSAGGALAGLVTLGPLGAVMFGGTKQKKLTNKTKYLVITYSSNDEVKYLVFDVTRNLYVGNQIKNFYWDLKRNPAIKSEL